MVHRSRQSFWSNLIVAAAVGTAGWLGLPGAVARGQVFSFGTNDTNGQGTAGGFVTVADIIDMSSLAGKEVTQLSAGTVHSLLLTEDGTAFSFGANTLGSTGQGTSSGLTLIATPIDTTNLGGETIAQVSAGFDHSLILADDGSVFSFGNNANGRTGQSTVSGRTEVATPIFSNSLGGRAIAQVSAGRDFSLLLAEDGTAFAFGLSSFGRTGLGIDGNTNTLLPTQIDTANLAGHTVTQVSAGFRHSLILTDDGTVFSFGNNDSGRTGLSTTTGNTSVATEIDDTNLGGRTITQVSAGSAHSLILANDGTVFSFGSNIYTGLGFGAGVTTIATPIATSLLGWRRLEQISAGGDHSLLLADDGTVFAFGSNGSGSSGLGPLIGTAFSATPIVATNLGGVTVTQVSTGGSHGLLLAGGFTAPYTADFDLDGDVDGNDLYNPIDGWQARYGTDVDGGNFLDWQRQFGSGVPPVAASAIVPEPSSTALLLTMTAAGIFYRRT